MAKNKAKKKPESKSVALVEVANWQRMAKEFESFIKSIEEQFAQADAEQEAAPPPNEALAPYIAGPPAQRDRVAEFIFMLGQLGGSCRAEAKQREERARHFERLAEKIKFSLKLYMEMNGITEAEGFAHTFKVKKNPPSVLVLEESRIPEEYLESKPTVRKDKIKEALLEGKEVPGATLRADSTRLEIK